MFQVVHFILGVVLMATGGLKLYQLTIETQDESFGTLLLMIYAEAELLGGIWLVGGFNPAGAHPWVVVGFAGLAMATLFRGLGGKCSCGCFGSLAINPWAVLVLDMAALVALLLWRPPVDPEELLLDHPARLLGLGCLAIAISVTGWQQADSITLAGTATRDGSPLEQAILAFTGESGKATVHTESDGRFRVYLVGLGRYAVTLSGVPEVATPTGLPSAGRAGKKKSVGGTKQPPALAAANTGRTLSWIEVSGCSEGNRTIEFR